MDGAGAAAARGRGRRRDRADVGTWGNHGGTLAGEVQMRWFGWMEIGENQVQIGWLEYRKSTGNGQLNEN